MEPFSVLLAICAGNSPLSGEVPAQRPETRSFDIFFDLRLNKRLSKQTWGWWFETLSCPLWCQCNEVLRIRTHVIQYTAGVSGLDNCSTYSRFYSTYSLKWIYHLHIFFSLAKANCFSLPVGDHIDQPITTAFLTRQHCIAQDHFVHAPSQ